MNNILDNCSLLLYTRQLGKRGDMRITGPAVAQLLHVMIKALGAKQVLELGVSVGYSTIYMARALPEGGMITAMEWDTEVAAEAIDDGVELIVAGGGDGTVHEIASFQHLEKTTALRSSSRPTEFVSRDAGDRQSVANLQGSTAERFSRKRSE